jgi:hypothetical protein
MHNDESATLMQLNRHLSRQISKWAIREKTQFIIPKMANITYIITIINPILPNVNLKLHQAR